MYRSPIKTLLINAINPEKNRHKEIPTLIRSQLSPRAIALQYNANNPVEDTFTLKHLQLSSLPSQSQGIFMAVFDGHGGNQLSIFANENIYNYFNSAFESQPDCSSESERIINALYSSIAQIESEFLNHSYNLYQQGEGRLATVGSCALIALVINNNLYVANIGDSKAKLLSLTKDNKDQYTVTNLSTTFNARKAIEQARLKQEFPNDPSIVLCKDPSACYVKGRLQPTRSLGDFHLKYEEFNEHILTKANRTHYKKEIKDLSNDKPYISSIPEIKVYPLTEEDKWIILGTDGLWDFLKSREVAQLLKESVDIKEDLASASEGLVQRVLEKAAMEQRMSYEQLINVKPGRIRRNMHDDITMILFDLNRTKH